MYSLEALIEAVQEKLREHLPPLLNQHKGLKVWVGLLNTYEPIEDDKEKKIPIVTKTRLRTNEPDIENMRSNSGKCLSAEIPASCKATHI